MGDMVMEEVLKFYNKYPILNANKTKALITIFSPLLFDESLKLSLKLRQSGINCELYPDPEAKLEKQLKYADKKGIPYAIILGPEEVASDTVTIKNMKTQIQKKVFSNGIVKLLNG
jgi:histidyl-tRNA synthetase